MSTNGSYENANIYQPDEGQAILRDESVGRTVLQLRCPHCGAAGSFESASATSLRHQKKVKSNSSTYVHDFMAQMRICPNLGCRGLVFTLSNSNGDNVVHPPELIRFSDDNIPPALLATLKEAILCHSVGGYRAAAMMVRRLLEEICDEAGATSKHLHGRLKELRSQITLPEELFEVMNELKSLGNDAAHIEAKAYQVIEKEEAELSIELAQEILRARFQHKGLLSRLQARRTEKVSD